MNARQPAVGTQPNPTGIEEPKAIIMIGGPSNGRKIADLGQTCRQTAEGDLYKRVRMDAGDALGRLSFDILAYWGKSWEQESA